MIYRLVIAVHLVCGFGLGIQSPRLCAAQLKEGWQKEVDIPEAKVGRMTVPATKLKLWVEQGWLVARYDSPERGREWQVVLAQAKDPEEPQVQIDKPLGFEIDYGRYFIREHFGHLRLWHKRKTKDSPPWPSVPIDNVMESDAAFFSGVLSKQDIQAVWTIGDWRWLGCGLCDNPQAADPQNAPQSYDVWMRVQHKLSLNSNRDGGIAGSISDASRLVDMNVGDYKIHDEGDLFVGQRSLDTGEKVRAALANVLNGKAAPELAVKKWFNAPADDTLQKLRGKVVLLYFWNETDYQPFASILQKKFKDSGLVVIGMHPNRGSDKLDALIKDREISLPIAVDTVRADTERNYFVKVWPTYVLIDQTGKVRQGYLENPPVNRIEELLTKPQQ